MKIVRIVGWSAAILALLLMILAATAFYLLYAPAPAEPKLGAAIEKGTIRVGDLDRTYRVYVPPGASASPPLVIAFHGSMDSSEGMRRATGYEFDRLADAHGFVVAYPQGFEGHWNDCRKVADYAARKRNIDDLALFDTLIARLQAEHGIDPARVFVVGLSNGGHFVFRLALERPDRIAGAAAFGANLPTDDNSVCVAKGPPPPIMLVNGTEDPINPYGGGVVTVFGFGNRGTVRSARETADYFARRLGAGEPVTNQLASTTQGDSTSADRLAWGEPGREVVLFSINGGGHVVPQPVYSPQRILGRVTSAINGPEQAWTFFSRQPPRGRQAPPSP
jgi:polyhydroxybutyrate depolymerase